MTRCKVRARRGLTLIELVVALGVGGAALGAGAMALGGLVDRRDALDAQLKRVDEALRVRRSLETWLGAAQLDDNAGDAEFRGVNQQTAIGSDDALIFRSVSRDVLDGRPSEIQLRILRDTVNRLVATARAWGSAQEPTVILDVEAQTLEIEYLLQEGMSSTWIPSWTSGTVLPAAVRIRVGASTATGHRLLSLPIHIQIAR